MIKAFHRRGAENAEVSQREEEMKTQNKGSFSSSLFPPLRDLSVLRASAVGDDF
jgi:hypothetical protein